MKKFNLFLFMLLFVMLVGIQNVSAEEYVAKIGNTSYGFSEFLGALTQTQENDKIVILQDIDLTSVFTSVDAGKNPDYVPFADNVTIDLNGHSIKTNNNSITYVGNDLTIKNGKLIVNGYGDENEGSYALFLGRLSDVTTGYVLEDLVIEGGLNVRGAQDVVLKNVTATGTNYYSVWADYYADITIESGNFSSNGVAVFGVRDNNESNITIKGGNVVVGDVDLYVSSSNCKAPIIVGGTYDMDVTDYVATGYVSKKSGNTYTVSKLKTVTTTEFPIVDNTTAVEEVVFGVKDAKVTEETLLNSLDSLLTDDEELSTLVETENVTVAIEMTDIDETKLDEKVVSDMKKGAGNATIATYLDISVVVRKTDSLELLTTIGELTEDVTLMVLLPEELKNTDENVVRTYYIIRRHVAEDGTVTVEKLPTTLSSDGNSLTFETSEFSTYALAYSDSVVKTTANPRTFDGIGSSIIMGLVSLFGLVGIIVYLKKRNKVRA